MAWYGKQFVSPVVLADNDFENPDREAPFFATCPTFSDAGYRVPGQPAQQWEDVVRDGIALVTPDLSFWMVVHNGHIVAEGQRPAMVRYIDEYTAKLEELNGIDYGGVVDEEVIWQDD